MLKYLSMLLLHLIFLQNLLLFISSISVGRGKLQKERHSSMMSLLTIIDFRQNALVVAALKHVNTEWNIFNTAAKLTH